MATEALKSALEEKGMEYQINEGDGAFYGPKIDFHLRILWIVPGSVGRYSSTSRCPKGLTFLYERRWGKTPPSYDSPRGFGSMERFIGILTEHYAGAFPVWLAPVQVRVYRSLSGTMTMPTS